MRIYFLFLAWIFSLSVNAQLKWTNVDSLYQPLPSSVHVYFTNEPIDTAPFRAYYLIADLKDKKIDFTADTTLGRRFTPTQFHQKNDQPLVVVNCTFFSFATNQNLNVVIKDGKLVAYNVHTIPGRGKDTLTYRKVFGSAIGISKKRKADIAWTFTDSSMSTAAAIQEPLMPLRDSFVEHSLDYTLLQSVNFKKWEVQTAVGGGPVLLQKGEMRITNNEELKFAGKAINDKHPRTAMGYTKDDKLIILVVQGRFPGIAEGATLGQEAQILKDLGCWEALNLDGGGSSCMLVNGKETIKPSDKEGQRAVPAVFMILTRSKATK
jgi:exopolysaccharide biosynthesis protein